MKIIHTADTHFNSVYDKLARYYSGSGLAKNTAKEIVKTRNAELLSTFKRMVDWAIDEKVNAIIVAGDIVDNTKEYASGRDVIYSCIESHPEITFFMLGGNHDTDNLFQSIIKKYGELPDNLVTFGSEWSSYTLTEETSNGILEVVVTGAEFTSDNPGSLVKTLSLDHSKFNIVTLHGQVLPSVSEAAKPYIIPINEYSSRGIDYMALGHIHKREVGRLDSRGIYSYSGCLEGRGFDESGPKGFNLLTITATENLPKMELDFIQFAKRAIHLVYTDVTGCDTSDAALAKITWKLDEDCEGIPVLSEDIVRVILTGEVDMETMLDIAYIQQSLEDDYFYLEVVDDTRPFIDYDSFAHDMTLKGEFIRKVRADEESGLLSEDEAADIISMGIKLLFGEEKLK